MRSVIARDGIDCTVSERYQLTAGDRILQFASISFDVSTEEIFGCLSRGATLVLRTDSMMTSADSAPDGACLVTVWAPARADVVHVLRGVVASVASVLQFDYDRFVQEFDQIAEHVRSEMAVTV